jgi:hypothetical protein
MEAKKEVDIHIEIDGHDVFVGCVLAAYKVIGTLAISWFGVSMWFWLPPLLGVLQQLLYPFWLKIKEEI